MSFIGSLQQCYSTDKSTSPAVKSPGENSNVAWVSTTWREHDKCMFWTVTGWVLTSLIDTWQSQRKHRKLDPATCKALCIHLRYSFPKHTLLHLFYPWRSEGQRLWRTIIERKYKLQKGWDGKVPKFLARNFPWIKCLQGRDNIYHCQIPFPKQVARISPR